jgi:hypothetical protein
MFDVVFFFELVAIVALAWGWRRVDATAREAARLRAALEAATLAGAAAIADREAARRQSVIFRQTGTELVRRLAQAKAQHELLTSELDLYRQQFRVAVGRWFRPDGTMLEITLPHGVVTKEALDESRRAMEVSLAAVPTDGRQH